MFMWSAAMEAHRISELLGPKKDVVIMVFWAFSISGHDLSLKKGADDLEAGVGKP